MDKYLKKFIEYGFYAFIFLLPWQARWIWHEGLLNGKFWEYGSFSLYAVDIIFLVVFITSLFLNRPQSEQLRQWWVLVLSFFLICFSSILWSQNKELSWYAILKLSEAILLFWLVLRIKIKWPYTGIAIVTAGVMQSLLGIYQFFNQQVVANKWLGLAGHFPGALGDAVIETAEGRWLRAYGMFPHPNMLAGFLVICLVVLIGFLIAKHDSKRDYLYTAIFGAAALAIMSVGLILTFSRSAWFTLALVVLIFLAVSIWQKNKFSQRIAGVIIFSLILSALASAMLLPDVWQTRLVGGRLETQSLTARSEYYSQAVSLIKDNWYQGTGIGSYTQALYNKDSSKAVWDYQPVHNIYLLVAVEIGIFGGLILLLIIIRFFQTCWRSYKLYKKSNWFFIYSLSFLALIMIGLFDHFLWSMSFGLLFFWLILGLWVSIYRETFDQKNLVDN